MEQQPGQGGRGADEQSLARGGEDGSEDWLIVVTTDHGHTDAGGHGGNSANERQTFLIADGTPAGDATQVSVGHSIPTPSSV